MMEELIAHLREHLNEIDRLDESLKDETKQKLGALLATTTEGIAILLSEELDSLKQAPETPS